MFFVRRPCPCAWDKISARSARGLQKPCLKNPPCRVFRVHPEHRSVIRAFPNTLTSSLNAKSARNFSPESRSDILRRNYRETAQPPTSSPIACSSRNRQQVLFYHKRASISTGKVKICFKFAENFSPILSDFLCILHKKRFLGQRSFL